MDLRWKLRGWLRPPRGGSGSVQPNRIRNAGGRIESTAHCNYIEARMPFRGDMRVELDVEKGGAEDYPCWDYYFELRPNRTASAVIRFDHQGSDSMNLGPGCAQRALLPAESPNRGRAILTFAGGRVQFAFAADGGPPVEAGAALVGRAEPMVLRIWIAGMPRSPRFVDNVRVFSLGN